jgi:hypothetical protein
MSIPSHFNGYQLIELTQRHIRTFFVNAAQRRCHRARAGAFACVRGVKRAEGDAANARSGEMKMVFMPTLSEMRDMLGEELYVKFMWMWREQDQDARALERRARYASAAPARKTELWPTPVFARASEKTAPTPAQAFQTALLRAPRLADGIEVGELAGFIDRVGAREESREVAVGGSRRRRR